MASGLRIVMIPFLLGFFLLVGFSWEGGCEPFDTESTQVDKNEALREINIQREREGVAPLSFEPAAETAGAEYAEQLAVRKVLSHYGKNGSRVMERYRDAGGTGTSAAENLGSGSTIKSIVEAWLESPSHRKIMLRRHWTRGGAGIRFMENGRMVLVFVFSNSRWETESLLKNESDGNVYLRGRFFRESGIELNEEFSLPQLRIDGNFYESTQLMHQSKNERIVSLLFLFPPPERWKLNRLAPAFLETQTAMGWNVSDLLFLDAPTAP